MKKDKTRKFGLLREFVGEAVNYVDPREVEDSVDEDMKNIYSKHQPTVDSQKVLRTMHDAPGVMAALTKINNPQELASVIEAIIDACPIVRKDEVLNALRKVEKHEKKTRR